MDLTKYEGLKKIDFEESKRVQLDILKFFHNFCIQNNITYFISFGTLLGAVRHKGFIPWDDDIDVIMPRPDYYKAIEIFNEKCKDSNYELISPTSEFSKHPYIKLIDKRTIKVEPGLNYHGHELGIDIDIFLLSGRPSDDKENIKYCKKVKYNIVHYGRMISEIKGLSLYRKCLAIARRFPYFSKEYYFKRANKLIEKYPYENCEYVGETGDGGMLLRDKHLKSCYEQIDMEFEGHMFKAPIGYDEVLKAYYGDYMKLPPIEQQVTHHSNASFWK